MMKTPSMPCRPTMILIAGLALLLAGSARAIADEQTGQYTIIGLFSPDREKDLRDVLENISEFQLVQLDYENARATIRYDLHALMPEQNPKKPPKPEQIIERLNNILGRESDYTFSVRPASTVPPERLTKLELKVGILDCKGCRYAAYLAVMKADGVDRATVGADSVVTAWIDPSKTDRAGVEAALKKARIECLAKPAVGGRQ